MSCVKIKTFYQRAIDYYDQKDYQQAENLFADVIKCVYHKKMLMPITEIGCNKKEILDSMYHIGLIRLNDHNTRNYEQAAAIFQFCFNFITDHPIEDVDPGTFLNDAHEVEKTFLKSICYSDPLSDSVGKIEKYKDELKIIRESIGPKLDKLDEIKDFGDRVFKVREIYSENIRWFTGDHGFVQRILIDCIEQLNQCLNTPDVSYAIVSLCSFANGIATPWSDLEFAIILDNTRYENYTAHKQYFVSLVRLFHIKVINLGETALTYTGIETLNNYKSPDDQDDWFWDSVTKFGFTFDAVNRCACKTPLGRKGYKTKIIISNNEQQIIDLPDFDLIKSADEMAQYQKCDRLELNDIHLVQALRTVRLIYGDHGVVDDYRTKLKNAIDINVLRKRSIKLLYDDIEKYQLKPHGIPIDVKKDIYRIIDRIICDLSNYYDINSSSTWDTLDQLNKFDVFSEQEIEDMRLCLSIATELRLRVYDDYDKNYKTKCKNTINLSMPHLISYYQTLILKVQDRMKLFCDSEIKKLKF